MNRHLSAGACGVLAMVAYTQSCRADTITDWDTKATAVASSAALGEREVAIVDLAMFDAVNSIARRCQPYLEQLPTTEPTSADATAASAAATALALLHPQAANDFKTALAEYLSRVSAPPSAIEAGTRLGETVAHKIVENRATDGRHECRPLPPQDQARAIRADGDDGVFDLAHPAAVRTGIGVPVSPRPAAGADESRMGGGLQRDQGTRRQDE